MAVKVVKHQRRLSLLTVGSCKCMELDVFHNSYDRYLALCPVPGFCKLHLKQTSFCIS